MTSSRTATARPEPLTAVLTVVLASCGGDAAHSPAPGPTLFREITARVGVDFVHEVDFTGLFPLPEITGSGCAVFDANGDGKLDLYFINAGRYGGAGAPNTLYLGRADGTYRDATEQSGLGDTGYGMGVAVGDIDNDGDLDVYVSNHGTDALYSNDGDGTFTDITERVGVSGDDWSTSVSLLDYDVDGHLDIYVVHYVVFEPNRLCTNQRGQREYCNPRELQGVSDKLYRNRGDGTFEDVSASAGIAGVAFNGLGIVVDDFDDDGWPDVYVANDGQANHLWMNERDGTFREDALLMGVAVNAHGVSEASMGVAAGDVDGDGDVDLFMTHLLRESNTLYLRDEFGFVDSSSRTGLAGPSLSMTGFGTVMFDVEHDGDLDLAVANGRVERGPPHESAEIDPLWNRYAEPNQLFLNDGSAGFSDISAQARSLCGTVEVTRGLAVADLDEDGDLDIVIANCRGPARVYENIAAKSGHWLQANVVDPRLNRAVHGATVFVRAGGRVFRRAVVPQQSYLSSSAMTTHFGLGDATHVEGIVVRWPGGQMETFAGGPADVTITLARGEGQR